MAKKNFYAIKKGKGVKNIIVNSWDECSKFVIGYNAEYKGFSELEDAENFIGIKKKQEVEVIIEEDKPEEVHAKTVKKNKLTKKERSNTAELSFRIPKDLYNCFMSKCTEMGLTEDIVIKNMLKEWLL